MIALDKNEYFALKKMGFINHVDLFKTYSKHPHYYMRETSRCIKALEKYKNKTIIVHCGQ